MWPYLARLSKGSLRLLDAGCGEGTWALELAARRPAWRITGVDHLESSLRVAELARRRLGLGNIVFEHHEFLGFRPVEGFDVVLSVASAHYLLEQGRGEDLFRAFGAWLNPNGLLLLFGPRCRAEVPWSRWLPPPFELHDVMSHEAIQSLCAAAGLDVEVIAPAIGVLGTLAEQIARAAASSRVARLLTYPLQLALAELDRVCASTDVQHPSSSWLLVARRPGGGHEQDVASPVAEPRYEGADSRVAP